MNKCIRTRLNVQCCRCPNHKMCKEGTKSNLELCIYYALCQWGCCLKRVNRVYRNVLQKKKGKKRQQFLLSGGISFLFSNLYINCKREKLPVQSICQLTCFTL